jgi:hypothetical protein
MVERITRSTYSGGVANSGDRGLASPAKQASIPRSGSFTGCVHSSQRVGWGWGKLDWLVYGGSGLGGCGHTAHGQTTVNWTPVRLERARKSVTNTWEGFIGAGAGQGAGWPLARRGARSGVLWQAQGASNTWSLQSARVPELTQVANVRILAKIRRGSFPGT